jgi:hypothetical protein
MKRFERYALGAPRVALAAWALVACGSTAYIDVEPLASGPPVVSDPGGSGGASGSGGVSGSAAAPTTGGSSTGGSSEPGFRDRCGEVCDDGIDNDFNGYVDCFDQRCRFNPACAGRFCDLNVEGSACPGLVCPRGANMPSTCQCEIDHRLVAPLRQTPGACCGKACPSGQFLDFACNCYSAEGVSWKPEPATGPEICNDSVDNDHDGYIDCFDSDCRYDSACGYNFCDLTQHASGCGGLVCPPDTVKDPSCVCLAGDRVILPLHQDVNDCCGHVQDCGERAYRDAKCVCRTQPFELPACHP